MIKFLWRILFGKCKITFDSADAELFLGIVKNGSVPFDKISCGGEKYTAILSEGNLKPFLRLADEAELSYEIERFPGIPLLYRRYKHRPGIIIGIVVFLGMIFLSESIIWDFEISGNEKVSDAEIIEALENEGCHAGAFYSNLHFAQIQNNCLVDTDSLAWISVNMDGNLARVEVREKRVVPIEYEPVKGKFGNIVAAEDGVIVACNVKRGKAEVERGSVVRKGELLISGVINMGETRVRYEYADGEVMAEVHREIEAYVPFKKTVQTPTGEKNSEIQLKIFGKTINLSPKGSIEYELYGKIVESEKLSLPYNVTLPIWMKKTVYSEMRVESLNLSEEEALQEAREDANARLGEMADAFQVVSVSEKYASEKDGVRVTLSVYGIADIATNYGFTVSGDGAAEIGDN